MISKVITWDCEYDPPIDKIVAASNRIKDAKVWTVNEVTESYICIIAANKEDAAQAYVDYFNIDLSKLWIGYKPPLIRWKS